MNVLLVNSTCKVGGVSTFMLSLQGALRSAGHTCELFFFERGPMEPHLPAATDAHFGGLADCLRLVAKNRVEIVHANNVDWPTGISAVRTLGARLILTAHKMRAGGWTYGWNRSNCDAFAAVAHWIARELQPHTDAPVEVIHNGIDTSRFTPGSLRVGGSSNPDPPEPIVAWVGRGSAPIKRLERLAAAAPALAAAGCRLWIIDHQGPNRFAEGQPEAARLLNAVAERWEGVDHARMPGVYREVAASGGCLLSTAQQEGLPLALLEAQACGVPVIAAQARGVDECVRPEHGGILFDIDAADLTTVVLDSLQDREVTRARGRAAAAFVVSEFSLEGMCRRYLQAYTNQRRPAIRAFSRLRWSRYRDQRLGVAYGQFAAAQELASAGEWPLAYGSARTAAATAPTMFARPSRLVALLTIGARAPFHAWSSFMRRPMLEWLDVTPRRKTPKPCGTDDVLDGRKPCQMGWYSFIAEQFDGEEVLDVGCGSGEGLKLIAARASRAVGIDLDERLRRPDLNIEIKSIADVPDKAFDNVVCLDVIEHVAEDRAFVAELFRVARKRVFVTTPNYTMSRNRHPYHVREYTPGEFTRLFKPYGEVTLYGGSSRGLERSIIARRAPYFLVNALYTWKPTLLAAKVAKRLLGVTIWKHNAALVRLPHTGVTKSQQSAAA